MWSSVTSTRYAGRTGAMPHALLHLHLSFLQF
eukprot:SAG22_NODE_9151_length_607_cov_1.003937_2_plen_31_part_01